MPTFRSVLLASAMGMLGIQSTVAQQSEGERPSWALERPEQSPAAEQLAPVSPPPIPTACEELPLDAITLPAGFEVEVFASGLANARSLALGQDGTVFVGTRLVGRVYAVTGENGETEVSTIAQGLHRPNGVAYKDGALYVAEVSRVLRYDDIHNRLDDPPEPAVVYDDLPRTSRTAGSSSPSARTISSTCPLVPPATSASRPRNTPRSGATTPTARARK